MWLILHALLGCYVSYPSGGPKPDDTARPTETDAGGPEETEPGTDPEDSPAETPDADTPDVSDTPANDSDPPVDVDTDSPPPTGPPDRDGDGWSDDADCAPDDGAIYPASPALCAGRTCGWDGCGGQCGGVACVDQPSSNEILQIVTSWYRTPTSNALLSEDPNEAPSASTFRGQLFYAADDGTVGDVPLYRLYQAAPGSDIDDHMVSVDPNEGAPSFSLEAVLAHGWSQPREGQAHLYRYLSTSPYDHDAGFGAPLPFGYALEGGLAWVYPRYGLEDEVLTTVAGSEVTLGLNAAAGGAVWSLVWGGQEFLSAYDFGRQLQIAFQMNGAGEADNPTEAGDRHATPSDPDGWRHGSPLLAMTTGPGTAWTRTRPLQWQPEQFHTGAHDTTRNPVAWNGTFEKELTLDEGGNPHVIGWTTRITFPEDHASLNIELATAYLTGQFTNFYTYDAATGRRTNKTASIPSMGCVDPSLDVDQRPEAGGVIVSTASGGHALGVYRRRALQPTEGYGLCNFPGGPTGPYDFATSKWNLLERPPGGLSAGTYTWRFFLVVGSLNDCTAAMDALYQQGR
jgi:hypothetical protein